MCPASLLEACGLARLHWLSLCCHLLSAKCFVLRVALRSGRRWAGKQLTSGLSSGLCAAPCRSDAVAKATPRDACQVMPMPAPSPSLSIAPETFIRFGTQSFRHNLAEALLCSKCQWSVADRSRKQATVIIRSLMSDLALMWLAQNGRPCQVVQPFPTTGLSTSCTAAGYHGYPPLCKPQASAFRLCCSVF